MRTLITFVSEYYPSNTGFSQAFQHLHKCLLQENACDRVLVFSFGENKESPSDKIQVVNVSKVKGLRALSVDLLRPLMQNRFERELTNVFSMINDEIRQNDVQMFLLETMYMGWLIPILKKRYHDIPVMCRFHGTAPEYTAFYAEKKTTKYRHYLINEIFSNSNIAVTTEFYINFFSEWFKDYKKFIDRDFFILPNTTLFESSESEHFDKVCLLQLGRMDQLGYHQKGYQDTIKALLYLEQTNPDICKQVCYVTIGNGKMASDFLSRTGQLKYIEHRHFTSLPNEEVKKIELGADIILLPSRCEGMSMFGTEVLAAGKPIIYTFGNGLDCLCRDNYNGLGFRYYDYLHMAENIKILITDKSKRNEFSNHSKELYKTEYSYSAVAKKYNTIIQYLGR